MRRAAARRGDREGRELRDLGVRRAGHRVGQAWVDFDVYMPDCWAKDPQRRKKAGIPEGLAFATKPELAIAQVRRLMAAGLRVLWAAADEVYGRCGDVPGRAAGRSAWPTSSSSPATTGSPSRRTRSPALTRRFRRGVRAAVLRERARRAPATRDWALLATADPREFLLIRRLPGPGQEPVHLLPVPGAGRPARDHDLLHHHRGPPLASRSRPPLLPVKRDLSFTAALLVLLPAFRRFLPGVVPSGRGCSSRAGGPCARGARASAARRR